MAQTFFPITPVNVVPGSTDEWVAVDISAHIPSGATGGLFHVVGVGAAEAFGLRKNGSTDDRTTTLGGSMHTWAAIGVDGSRILEACVGSTSMELWLVGYTMSGVTFKTNADDMSLGDTEDWYDIDCSTEAPSAIGLIFEVVVAGAKEVGLRKNGSTDDRKADVEQHGSFGAMIGCDASQICEGYIETTAADFFLVGYITDGATFNTNATDLSLDTTGSWLDLDALPSGSGMGFIEVKSTSIGTYGLRKNGSSEDIYLYLNKSLWAFVECDSLLIEGKIGSTDIDFWLVGYAEGVAVTTAYKDIATRFFLGLPSYKDTATRFVLNALNYQDIATRFTLWVQGHQDIATRFRLVVQNYRDIAARFKLRVQGYKDIATRFRLWVQNYQDIATRFDLVVTKDISTRFRLTVQAFNDISTRFRLRVQGFTDIATRFRLIAQAYEDIAARFQLTVQAYRDTASRFKLIAQDYRDAATRFRLWVEAYQDTATRFILTVFNYQDVATRFRLTVRAFQDTATRFKLTTQAYKDIVAKFKLSIQTCQDVSTRFFLYQPTWEEIQIQQAVAALEAEVAGLELEPGAHFRI